MKKRMLHSKYTIKLLALIAIAVLSAAATRAQTNIGFENGLTGWLKGNDTDVIQTNAGDAYKGNVCAIPQSAGSELYRKLSIGPLAPLQYHAYLKASAKGIEA